MERKYEVMYILRPDAVAEDADKILANLEATITKGNGKLVSSEKLGSRKLAYTVRKFNEGNYNLLTIEAGGSLVAELERRLRVMEQVIKFITVRMDEEEKRINKVRKLRSTRIKQSTLNAQSAQSNSPGSGPSSRSGPATYSPSTHAAPAAAQAPAAAPPSAPPASVEARGEVESTPAAIA